MTAKKGPRYAEGKYAVGECARSGRKMLLKDMIGDGYYPNLIVDPAWWEDKHPQEYLPKVSDPEGLYRPSPEREAGPSASVLTSTLINPNEVDLDWTAATTNVNQIAEYQIFKSANVLSTDPDFEQSFSLLATIEVQRDAFGEITGPPLTFTDNTIDTGSNFYHYYVLAVPVRVGEAESPQTAPSRSNIEEIP